MIALASAKIGQLSDADLTAIEAVSDQSTLSDLIASLGRARSAARARAALERARGRTPAPKSK